jgi:TrmH family RNA methyltransferase
MREMPNMLIKRDEIKKLQQKKYRQEYGCYLAEGEHLALELGKALSLKPELERSRILVTHEYAAAGFPDGFPSALDIDTVNAKQMAQLCDTRSPQGVIAIVPILAAPPVQAEEKFIYLYEIQDPGNLGTILRTLAWFGGFRCLLSPGSVDPYNPKVVRASMGAIFTVPIETEINLSQLSQRFDRCAILDAHGTSVKERLFHNFECYIFGNEARGIPSEFRTSTKECEFTITGHGSIESLNVATAVNICVYELCRN